jgi:hypothetical protein
MHVTCHVCVGLDRGILLHVDRFKYINNVASYRVLLQDTGL